MDKIVFLDMDGVLNSGYYCKRNNCQRWLEENKLQLIKKLVDETKAKVVLTSYRCQYNYQKNLIINDLRRFEIAVSGIIDFVNNKNIGVENYLAKLEKDVNFVIIDDVDYGYKKTYLNHFIQTSQWWGLMEHHVEMARKILENSQPQKS